jgi:SWI/SNF-related matrix-associated actin-dependent regulator of chromatin subfamily A3
METVSSDVVAGAMLTCSGISARQAVYFERVSWWLMIMLPRLKRLGCRTLSVYGKPGVRSMLEPLLRWATPGKRGFTDQMRAQSGVTFTQSADYRAAAAAGPSYASGSSQNSLYSQDSSSQSSQPQLSQRAMEAFEAQRRAEELRVMLAGLEKVDDEGRRANFLDALYGTQTADILNLPEHPSPPGKEEGSLSVDLLKHQVRTPLGVS